MPYHSLGKLETWLKNMDAYRGLLAWIGGIVFTLPWVPLFAWQTWGCLGDDDVKLCDLWLKHQVVYGIYHVCVVPFIFMMIVMLPWRLILNGVAKPSRYLLPLFFLLVVCAVLGSCLFGDRVSADSHRDACLLMKGLEGLRKASREITAIEQHLNSISPRNDDEKSFADKLKRELDEKKERRKKLIEEYDQQEGDSRNIVLLERLKLRSLAGWWGFVSSAFVAACISVVAWLIPFVLMKPPSQESAGIRALREKVRFMAVLGLAWIPCRIYTDYFLVTPFGDSFLKPEVVFAGIAGAIAIGFSFVCEDKIEVTHEGISKSLAISSAAFTALVVTFPKTMDRVYLSWDRMPIEFIAVVCVFLITLVYRTVEILELRRPNKAKASTSDYQ